MNLHINVKSPNNISKWQMGFNSAFKGLMVIIDVLDENINTLSLSLFIYSWTNNGRS
jgi:hypothetical protein